MAAKHYRRVMRSFAPERMRINATINYSYMENNNPDKMRQTLLKMTTKPYYEDYYDLIYLALAELEMRQKKEPQAIDYYKLAINHNKSGNTSMLLTANYKLALYYEKKGDYGEAQKYYASTATLMPSNDPDYKSVQNKAKHLNFLAENLKVIKRQDTLLRIAAMSDEQQHIYIERCIEQAKAEDVRRSAALKAATVDANAGTTQGSWYFYNAAAVQKGKEDFQKIWGNRPLADNWRYSSSNSSDMTDHSTDMPAQQESVAANAAPAYDAAYCMRGVPQTAEETQTANDSLASAMLGAAKVYRIYLNDNKNATAMLENLLKRYPQTEHKMEAYFYLYTMYGLEKNEKLANEYKQKLIDEFPDTELAESLRNPNYASKSEMDKRQSDSLFEQAYTHYVRSEYSQAQRVAQTGVVRYKDLPIAAHFALLGAMAKGGETDLAGHIYNLQTVVSAHPNTDAANAAQDMIDYLKGNETQILNQTGMEKYLDTLPDGSVVERTRSKAASDDDETAAAATYSVEEGKALFIIAFDTRQVNINQLRFDVMVFNTDLDAVDLEVSVQPLSIDIKLMSVGVFQRTAAAMEYYRSIAAQPDFAKHKDITMFVVTEENLSMMLRERYLSNYISFFRRNVEGK
jgi:hypothetical protein